MAKETKVEISDIITAEGMVSRVEHFDSISAKIKGGPPIPAWYYGPGNEALSFSLAQETTDTAKAVPERFLVHIRIPTDSFVVDSHDLFTQVRPGDGVRVAYKEESFVTYDYSGKMISRKRKSLIPVDVVAK